MRKEYSISIEKELALIESLSYEILEQDFNASNTVIISVSSDYSSIVGQIIRHNLSFKGEIADGFSVDVPYPDQTWTEDFIEELHSTFNLYDYKFNRKTLLLVEAGVIKGGNYKFLTEWIFSNYPKATVKTLTLFENTDSAFKSNFVGEYYDDKIQDLTFSWEKYNNHWNKS
jgi:hypothetical protein